MSSGSCVGCSADSPVKVIKQALQKIGDIIPPSNIEFDQAGRGNNWAYGNYNAVISKSGTLFVYTQNHNG